MKRVVVVGATSGIGRAVAAEYLRRGWHVGVVGRDRAKVERVVGELRAEPGGVVEGAVGDVASPEDVEAAFREILVALGQMDLLVYCAGVNPAEATTHDRIREVGPILDVNVRGCVHWLERGAEYLEPLGRGRLAAVGSMAGVRGRRGHPVYGASKAALHEYLEGLRHRLHGTGVGVTTVVPGWVRTPMLDEATARSPAAIDVERAARIIVRGLERGRDLFHVPGWWALVALGLRGLPRWLYKRIAPP
ncbi:MAG TPA: SDR family NAD(P)-dependent oxidoreductase [Longimicrobiales bacterium]|jgi:short-subunit dehydrogenase